MCVLGSRTLNEYDDDDDAIFQPHNFCAFNHSWWFVRIVHLAIVIYYSEIRTLVSMKGITFQCFFNCVCLDCTSLVILLSLIDRVFVASLLLDNLLSYLTSGEHNECKAIYLHVLTTNTTAIRFYERRNFHVHSCLPFYYSIKGIAYDGFSYVLYINGGQPPSTFIYPFILSALWYGVVRPGLCCPMIQ